MALSKESVDLLVESVQYYKTNLIKSNTCVDVSKDTNEVITSMRKIVSLDDLEKALTKKPE